MYQPGGIRMNAIVSVSFHTRKHAHVLEIIDESQTHHQTTSRSKIIRNLIIDGADKILLEKILDELETCFNAQTDHAKPYNWREDFLRRKQQQRT